MRRTRPRRSFEAADIRALSNRICPRRLESRKLDQPEGHWPETERTERWVGVEWQQLFAFLQHLKRFAHLRDFVFSRFYLKIGAIFTNDLRSLFTTLKRYFLHFSDIRFPLKQLTFFVGLAISTNLFHKSNLGNSFWLKIKFYLKF